jgi:hypothetical protein
MLQKRGVSQTKVKICRAKDIQDVQALSKQDPYVKVTLLPKREEVMQSKTCEGGGSDPQWDSMLTLAADKDCVSMELELWNENMAIDELIGKAEVSVSMECFGTGRRQWIPVDTGGEILVAIKCTVFTNPAPAACRILACKAEGLTDKATFAKMDPYLLATWLPKKLSAIRTKTAPSGGVAPQWNEELKLEGDIDGESLLLEVYDENTTSDDTLVGSFKVLASQIPALGAKGVKQWYDLTPRGKIECLIEMNEDRRSEIEMQLDSGAIMTCPPFINPCMMIGIYVYLARGLKEMNMFGSMSPYVTASYMTVEGPSKAATVSTHTAASGGIDPRWEADPTANAAASKLNFPLLLPNNAQAVSLCLEVLNEVSTAPVDETVGMVELDLTDVCEQYTGQRMAHPCSTGGSVECSIFFVEPLCEDNCTVGCQCRPGPHWSEAEGQDELGTVVGFRKADGSRYGKFPGKYPVLHAVVKWGTGGVGKNSRSKLYKIGAAEELMDEEVGLVTDIIGIAAIGGGLGITPAGPSLNPPRYELEFVSAEMSATLMAMNGVKMTKAEGTKQANKEALENSKKKKAEKQILDEKRKNEEKKKREAVDMQQVKRKQEKEERQSLKLAQKEAALKEAMSETQDQAQLAKMKQQQEELAKKRADDTKHAQRREWAAMRMQCVIRRQAAKKQVDRKRKRKLAAAVRDRAVLLLQRCYRRMVAQKHVAHRRYIRYRFKKAVRKQILIVSKYKEGQRRLLLTVKCQAIFRGWIQRRLWHAYHSGGVCVFIKRCKELKNVGLLRQDPYAKVTLWPSGTTARTAAVKGAGAQSTDPSFEPKHGQELLLPIGPAEDAEGEQNNEDGEGVVESVTVEIWNSAGGMGADKLVGSCEIDLPFVGRDDAQFQQHKLSTGGVVELKVFVVSREEVLAGAVKQRTPATDRRMEGVAGLLVEAHFANSLMNAQYFGAQSPHVSAQLIVGKGAAASRDGAEVSTLACKGGGVCPQWGRSSNNLIFLRPEPVATALQLNVCTGKTVIGTVDVNLTGYFWEQKKHQFGKAVEFELGGEAGKLTATLHRIAGPVIWEMVQAQPLQALQHDCFLFLRVEIHRADGLEQHGTLGKVFVRAVVATETSDEIGDTDVISCTSAAISIPGEDQYRWVHTMDNLLALKLPEGHGQTDICLEVRHGSGKMVTEGGGTLLGQVAIDWKSNATWGQRAWYELDTGGRVEASFHIPLPGF